MNIDTLRDALVIGFTYEKLDEIWDEACFRRNEGILKDKPDMMVQKVFYRAEVDYVGVLGEAAVAKVLGGKIRRRQGTDDGNDLEGLPYTVSVKMPTQPGYNLLVPRHQRFEDYYVLVLPIDEQEKAGGALSSIKKVNVAGYTDRDAVTVASKIEANIFTSDKGFESVRIWASDLYDIQDLIDIMKANQ